MTIDNPTTVVLAVLAGTGFGLVSIPHCIGMCGPLHLTMCLANSKRSFKSLTLFNIGRIAGYTTIGALCGLFGSQLTNLFPMPPAAQSAMNAEPSPARAEGTVVPSSPQHSSPNALHSPKNEGKLEVPASCCPAPNSEAQRHKGTEAQSDGKLEAEDSKKVKVPTSCCPPKNKSKVEGGILKSEGKLEGKLETRNSKLEVPTSCCPPEASTENTTDAGEAEPYEAKKSEDVGTGVPTQNSPATHDLGDGATPDTHPSVPDTLPPALGLPPLGRRILMYIFPAAILILVGIKGLLKKPGSNGSGSGGFISGLFSKLRVGGPIACGAAASLLPCGLLYVAFGIAVSTLSPLLGGVMLFFYCLTITFFLQMGIMVGTSFGRKLGPAVNKFFPYAALLAAAIYIALFIRSA